MAAGRRFIFILLARDFYWSPQLRKVNTKCPQKFVCLLSITNHFLLDTKQEHSPIASLENSLLLVPCSPAQTQTSPDVTSPLFLWKQARATMPAVFFTANWLRAVELTFAERFWFSLQMCASFLSHFIVRTAFHCYGWGYLLSTRNCFQIHTKALFRNMFSLEVHGDVIICLCSTDTSLLLWTCVWI